MSKKNRGANVIYTTRRPVNGVFPIGSFWIRVTESGSLVIAQSNGCGTGLATEVSRQEARLLARRIMQALEETR